MNAFTIEEFCRRNCVGRSWAYREAAAGRLLITKLGRKSIITAANEAAWLASLPTFKSDPTAPFGRKTKAKRKARKP